MTARRECFRRNGWPATGASPNWEKSKETGCGSCPRRPPCSTPCWRRKTERVVRSTRSLPGSATCLRSFDGIRPCHEPRSFAGELRHYQREGLGWLHFLDEFGFGGCLADDMGLGKTIQVLALLDERRRRSLRRTVAGQGGEDAQRLGRSLVGRRAAESGLQLDRRSRPLRPELRVLNYTGLDRDAALGPIQ